MLGKHRKLTDRIGQAQDLKHPEHIWPQLDARTDLLELLRLLEELHRKPLARERERRRQSANPSAHHENRRLSCPVEHIRHSLAHAGALNWGSRPTPLSLD